MPRHRQAKRSTWKRGAKASCRLFRSPDELRSLSPVGGTVRTVVHFQKRAGLPDPPTKCLLPALPQPQAAAGHGRASVSQPARKQSGNIRYHLPMDPAPPPDQGSSRRQELPAGPQGHQSLRTPASGRPGDSGRRAGRHRVRCLSPRERRAVERRGYGHDGAERSKSQHGSLRPGGHLRTGAHHDHQRRRQQCRRHYHHPPHCSQPGSAEAHGQQLTQRGQARDHPAGRHRSVGKDPLRGGHPGWEDPTEDLGFGLQSDHAGGRSGRAPDRLRVARSQGTPLR